MRIELKVDGRDIAVTTEHAASSYGQPVVLVDGELTDIVATDRGEQSEDAHPIHDALDALADNAGIHDGPQTRLALHNLAGELGDPAGVNGRMLDRTIEEFQRRGATGE